MLSTADDDAYIKELKLEPKHPYVRIVKKGKGFLGFGGKHYYTTSMGANKVFDEDQFKSTQIRAVIKKVKDNGSMHDFLYEMSRVGTFHFDKYATAGRRIDKKFHPSVYIFSNGVDVNIIKQIITAEVNQDITINTYSYEYLKPEVWCKYQLQQLYSYDVERDVFIENNIVYQISDVTYNGLTRKYECTLKAMPELRKQVLVTTSKFIESKDDKTDIVTIVTEQSYSLSTIDANETLLTVDEFTETEIKEVPKGSELAYSFTEIVSDETISISKPDIVKAFSSYDTVQQYYIIQYLNLNNLRMYYWIYNPTTDKYPALSNITDIKTAETIYPLSVIKQDFDYVTGEQKEATEKLLNSVGLSIDTLKESLEKNEHADKVMDCFVLIGVSPSEENDKAVSKVLYETIEYVYKNVGLFVNEPYNMTFKQGAYYNTILWTAIPEKLEKQKIMNVGECRHESKYTNVYKNYYMKASILRKYRYNHWDVVDIKTQIIEEEVTDDGLILYSNILLNEILTKVKIDYAKEECVPLGQGDFDCTPKWELTENLLFTYYYRHVVPYETEDGYTSYHIYYLPLEVQLYLDGSDCVGTVYAYSNKQIVTTTLTKQIDFYTTKTHTLMDFISSYTIDNPKQTVVIKLNGKNEELVFPILSDVMRKLSVLDRTRLLDNAIYLQHYAYDHEYVKWYKTSAFGALLKVIMVIILIVVTIVTWGSGTAPTYNLTAALWTVVETIVIAVALTMALKLIAKYTDGFLQAFLSAVAIVAVMYFTGGFADFGLNEAFVLVNSAVDAFNIYLGEKMEALQADANQFKSEFEARQEEQTEAMGIFNDNLSVLDVADFTINTDYRKTVNSAIYDIDNFYYLATEAYKNFDLVKNFLPETSVYNFCDNSLALRA
jgi:hypothetical protein